MLHGIHQLCYKGQTNCIQLRLESRLCEKDPLNKTVNQTYDRKAFVK